MDNLVVAVLLFMVEEATEAVVACGLSLATDGGVSEPVVAEGAKASFDIWDQIRDERGGITND